MQLVTSKNPATFSEAHKEAIKIQDLMKNKNYQGCASTCAVDNKDESINQVTTMVTHIEKYKNVNFFVFLLVLFLNNKFWVCCKVRLLVIYLEITVLSISAYRVKIFSDQIQIISSFHTPYFITLWHVGND